MDEDSDVASYEDLLEAIEMLDALEATATESQLYSLNRIKRAIKRVSDCVFDNEFSEHSTSIGCNLDSYFFMALKKMR